MTDTNTTAPDSPSTPGTPRTPGTPGTLPLPAGTARLTTAAGAIITLASTMLSWTWTAEFPGDLSYY